MQIGQLTAQVVQTTTPVRKDGKKPTAPAKGSSAPSQEAYKLDVRAEALSRLDQIRARIQAGYYNRPDVIDAIADRVLTLTRP